MTTQQPIPVVGEPLYGSGVCRVLVANGVPVVPGAEAILRRAEERAAEFKPAEKFQFVPYMPRNSAPKRGRPRINPPKVKRVIQDGRNAFNKLLAITPEKCVKMRESGMKVNEIALACGCTRYTKAEHTLSKDSASL